MAPSTKPSQIKGRNPARAHSNAASAHSSAPEKTGWTEAQIEAFFAILARGNPDPRTELEFHNPFTLLAAVALSAQATDKSVNRVTRHLFARADHPAAMLALGEAGIGEHIRTIGLWRNKARNLMLMSQMLCDLHGGEVPRERAALEALPGVGRKTANVVLNEAFGEPTLAVDTHIFRVANRTGLAPGANPLRVETALEAVVPGAYKKGAHHWLILHGRYVCLARKPRCGACAVHDLCQWPDKSGASPVPSAELKSTKPQAGKLKDAPKRKAKKAPVAKPRSAKAEN